MIKKRFFLASGLMIFFFACGEAVQEAPVKKEERKEEKKAAAPQAKIEVPSLFDAQKDTYTYNPAGKRDPFVPFSGEFVNYTIVPKTPLEKYALTELSLTGIIWGISDPRALIKAPDGYSYIVRINAPIGRNRGRISRITRKDLYIEEEYRDPTGKPVVKETKFALKAPSPASGEDENLKVKISDE